MTINILVFNCGSSSLNYKLYRAASSALEVLAHGKAHRVGVTSPEPAFIEHFHGGIHQKIPGILDSHAAAAGLVFQFLSEQSLAVDAIGHRFVHGGSIFTGAVFIDEQTLPGLEACLPLAPIHNPNSMSVIRACQAWYPGLPQYASFDTAFHAGLPEHAFTYALPHALVDSLGLRKYGFHGLSYQYVTKQAAAALGRSLTALKMIACHLGTGGSSVAAIQGGNSIDTSMGYSPLAGLIMSTRSGDLDPLLPLRICTSDGLDPAAVEDLLNKKSGLLGISAFSSDIRDLIQAAEGGHTRAALAVEQYTYRLRRTIGAYLLLLGGADALLFTDDIGLRSPLVRREACRGLSWAGVQLDESANLFAAPDRFTIISPPGARPAVLTMPTDEEWVIASQGADLLAGGQS